MDKFYFRHQFEEIAAKRNHLKPVYVAYGLMNSGKSSLLNMLTNNIEVEFFKTNDIRETTENKEFDGERCIFIDTPGLDANHQDDTQAASGVRQADIVLFVHQPQGELEANEISFLQTLVSSFGEHASKHIVIVLTKMDKEDAMKIDAIARRIGEQCESELNFLPSIFRVSNSRYRAGKLKSQEVLVERSSIPELLVHLESLAAKAMSSRRRRMQDEVSTLLDAIGLAEQKLHGEKLHLQAQISQGFIGFNQQIGQLRAFLDTKASFFKRI